MTDAVQQAARTANSSRPLELLARGGYAASGVVHLLLGALVVGVTFGGRGQTDQSGAFRTIATAPWGMALLWVLAVLLVALGLYHLVQCFVARGGSAADRWKDRASHAGQAVVFAALGVAAATVALGARPNGDRSAQTASRDVLSLSGGPLLLGLLAAGVVIGGIAFAAMGARRSFLKKVDLPGGRVGSAVTVLGVVGYVAKGGALAIVGALLVVAAVKADPEQAGGLDAAVHTLLGLPFGQALVACAGIGFASYGVYLFFRARYAKL